MIEIRPLSWDSHPNPPRPSPPPFYPCMPTFFFSLRNLTIPLLTNAAPLQRTPFRHLWIALGYVLQLLARFSLMDRSCFKVSFAPDTQKGVPLLIKLHGTQVRFLRPYTPFLFSRLPPSSGCYVNESCVCPCGFLPPRAFPILIDSFLGRMLFQQILFRFPSFAFLLLAFFSLFGRVILPDAFSAPHLRRIYRAGPRDCKSESFAFTAIFVFPFFFFISPPRLGPPHFTLACSVISSFF